MSASHTGNVTVDMESSSTRIQHVKGDVTIQGTRRSGHGRRYRCALSFERRVRGHGTFGASDQDRQLRSARTDLEFSRLDGRLDLDSGDLRADSITGPVRPDHALEDISLEGLSGDLRLQDDNAPSK